MFNLTVFLWLNGSCCLRRPDRRRGVYQSHGHLGGDTVAVCWVGITESSPLSASWPLLAAQHHWTARTGRFEERRKSPCPWVHLLLWGVLFFIFKERDPPAPLMTATSPWFSGSGGEEAQEKAFKSLAASPKAASPPESGRQQGKVLLDHPKRTPKV